MVFDWVEPGTTTKQLSTAMLAPSGVCSGQFSVRVSNDGHTLEFMVTWPDPLVVLKQFY